MFRVYNGVKQKNTLYERIYYISEKGYMKIENNKIRIIGKNDYVETPNKLYKYFGNISYADNAIKGKLHLDDPTNYNDPFEVTGSNLNLTAKESKSKIIKEACFTEISDSILMWAYYAHNHQGVCIEYDLKKLLDNHEVVDYYDYSDIVKGIKPIHYSPLRSNLEARLITGVYTKADVWQHELEWRLAVEVERNVEEISFDCVSSVYFGVRTDFNQNNVKEIIKKCSKNKIDVFQYRCSTNEYRLESYRLEQ